jgi:hypothetical protein
MAAPKKKARTAPASAEKAKKAVASKAVKALPAPKAIKPPKEVKEKRVKVDWESVESQYRANVVSLRVIAAQFGITEGTIRRRAKIEGWERTLAHKVRKAVKETLLRTENTQTENCVAPGKKYAKKTTHQPPKDADVINSAVDVIVTVARDHRKKLQASRSIMEKMLEELLEAGEHRDEIETAIVDETMGDPTSSKRRGMMLRAVALPSRAGVILNLSAAMKNIISLERQSFNMDDVPPPNDDMAAHITSAMSAREAADAYASLIRG